jgi:hypothetical protein
LKRGRRPDTPIALEIYHGGFSGPSYGAWWDGEQVVYESFDESYSALEQTRLSPSAAQWEMFWRTVDQLRVWDWAPRYEPGERFEPRGVVRDGVHWSVTLEHAGRRLESSGDGAGPGAIELDESQGFIGLLGALSRLLGGRAFS